MPPPRHPLVNDGVRREANPGSRRNVPGVISVCSGCREEASDVTEYIDESEEYLTSDSELESSEDKSEKHCRNMNLELDAESDSGKEEILNLEMDLILDCQEEEPMASPESKKSEVDVDLNENDINESDKTDSNSNMKKMRK